MGKSKDMQYSEPEPLTTDQIRDRLLRLDRDTRLEFFNLTVEPPEPESSLRDRHMRTRRDDNERRGPMAA